MANDFYRNKDKMELAKSNPRNQTFGTLSSSDLQYKNYLAGMKPRVKTPENDRKQSRTGSNNFRKSAGVDENEDEDKRKASRALYTEMSSVPTKRTTTDLSYDKVTNTPKSNPKPKMERVNRANSLDSDDRNEPAPIISVGKLRSMFDSPSNVSTVPLRNDSDRKKDHLKRYSAMEPLQRPKYDIKKVDVNVVGRVKLDVNAMVNDSNDKDNVNQPPDTQSKSSLNIDAMLGSNEPPLEEVNSNGKIDIDSTETELQLLRETVNNPQISENSSVPARKTKGMHGLLTRKQSSEFAGLEDNIVPTGTKTIDITSLLAPAPADDNNNNRQDNTSENGNEQSMELPLDFDLQRKRDLDRLMQANQEVKVNKAFNVKRRSLKDRLHEMSMTQDDSFDNDVPYESFSEPTEQPSININSHVNQIPSHSDSDTSIISPTETNDKPSEIIHDYTVISESKQNITVLEDEEKVNIDNDANDMHNTSIDVNLCNGNVVNGSELPAKVSTEISDIVIVDPEQVYDVSNTTTDNVNIGDEVLDGDMVVVGEVPNGNYVELSASSDVIMDMTQSADDSDVESEDPLDEKTFDSVVDRFDAFLTSHGIADPDILSPVPISDVDVDFRYMLNGKLDRSDDISSSSLDVKLKNADSNEVSLADDATSRDISDNLSLAMSDELPLISDDKTSNQTSASDLPDDTTDLPDEPMDPDEVSLTHFQPLAHSSHEDLSSSVSITTDGDMNLMDEILGHLENKGIHKSGDDIPVNDKPNSETSEVKVESPDIPKFQKQEKVDMDGNDNIAVHLVEVTLKHDDEVPLIEAETSVTPETVSTQEPQAELEMIVGNSTPDKSDSLPSPSHADASLITNTKEDINSDPVSIHVALTSGDIDMPSMESIEDTIKDVPQPTAIEILKNLATDESVDITSDSQIIPVVNQMKDVSVSEPLSEEIREEDTNTEPSIKDDVSSDESSDTDDVDQVDLPQQPIVQPMVREIKTPSRLKPQKSNLQKTKRVGSRKVNFKEPFFNDVILTYGPTEYDRANADIDPISSSAEWELEKRVDKMDVFSVDLQKDERGLGLSIIGLGVGTETGVEKLGIFVKTLTENGASQKDGRIQVNDQILEVNGISLVGVTQIFAAQTLKHTDGVVRFLMGREKSRRTQYSPGAPLAGNPEMHKHVEEMNKVLVQLEEFEDRALNAEATLEDVKLELLKAEERAHEAERRLKDTKEQLTAAVESPFVGSGRKLKNEIKKKGGKHEKLDTLQRSLADVTNRLSTSEENLSGVKSQNENREKQIALLTQKISDKDNHLAQMENTGKFLQNEIGCKVDEINTLRLQNGQLKDQLNAISEKHDIEKENWAQLQIELAVKAQSDTEEMQKRTKSLETENRSLRDEVDALTRRLEINEQLLKEVTDSQSENEELKRTNVKLLQANINEQEAELELTKEANGHLQLEIETLKGKNEYLQSLIVKLEREEVEPNIIDIELKFKEKEEEYLNQNDRLRAKISELEDRLRTPPLQEISPTLPIRGYVNVDELIKPIEPPQYSRDTKPSLSKEPAIELQIDVIGKNDEETNLLSNDSGIGSSVNNIDDIEPTTVVPPNNPILSPNPVPKPERGNFISINSEIELSPTLSTQKDDKTFKFDNSNNIEIKDIIETPNELQHPDIKTSQEDNINVSNTNLNVSTVTVTDNIDLTLVDLVDVKLSVDSSEQLDTDTMTMSSTPLLARIDDNSEKDTSTLSFHLDDLPEGKIDDIEEDQGQFQLIQEDVEEELPTPAHVGHIKRINSDISDISDIRYQTSMNGDLDGSIISEGGNFDQWLDKDWTRMDSTARKERAEMIAAEVSAHAPTLLRKGSSTSSTSSEETKDLIDNSKTESPGKGVNQRTQSIKIDASYFEKSHKLEDSFDYEGSMEIEPAVDDNVTEIAPLADVTGEMTKSLSFDSAIPPTPVLDNKVAFDKKAVMNNHRAKPSRSPRVTDSPTTSNVTFTVQEPAVSTSPETSTLPRLGAKANKKLQAAQSVPNLSMLPDHEKPSKRKHKYVFHLPKAFKKTKLGRQLSKDNLSKKNKDNVLSMSEADLTSHPDLQPLREEQTPYTPSLGNEADVVPMAEKTAAINLEKANDAATEEAVVPFADKEFLMTTSTSDSDVSLRIGAGDKGSSPSSLQNHLNLDSDSSLSLPSSRSASDARHVGSSISSPGGAQPHDRSMEIEFSSFTNSPVDGTTSPEFYNERGVDVEMTNGHSEIDTSYKIKPVTQWDVRQVGLWLTEINMNSYVGAFRIANVDGMLLLKADGRELKEYGVHNQEHRAHIKKYIKEFRLKFGKGGSARSNKSTKDKLQFWKGKYKLN